MHLISVTDRKADTSCRNTIGGSPFMPPGQPVPRCRICDTQMVLFFQFDIRPEFEIPFKAGSHLLIFACPTHNEPPALASIYNDSPLPMSYWDAEEGHFALLLYSPTNLISNGQLDEYIEPYILTFDHTTEDVEELDEFDVGSYDFKVGGVPGWMNYCINKKCTCGGEMSFICQTPDGFGFR